MSTKTRLSRRDVLKLAVAAAGSLVVGSRLPAFVARQHWQHTLAARLSALLPHQESAKVIGMAYLQQYPLEMDARILISRIAASPAAGDAPLFGVPDQSLRQLLDRMTRADFALDRVVNLQGWILSETEARLCALAALVPR